MDFCFDKVYENKFHSYSKKWGNENKKARLIKGILIASLTTLCFTGLFVIASQLHKLK